MFPNSEIVVSSKPELNYGIQEIAKPIRELFTGTALQQTCEVLPEFVFIVNIPAVESEQILIHGILFHELGHALYRKHQLYDRLLPQIQLREDLIRGLISAMSQGASAQLSPVAELSLRQRITQQVTERITRWVMELSSDAIGIRLFGPALYFAAIHLLLSFSHLDHCSKSHPPSRLRVKLMTRMIMQLYDVQGWNSKLQEFVRDWQEVSAIPILVTLPFDQIAVESLNTDAVLQLISDESAAAAGQSQYNSARLLTDIAELAPLFINGIPAGEIGPFGQSKSSDIVSIVNAGWHVYLCEFDAFRKRLHTRDAESRVNSAAKLSQLILKSLEIAETKVAWQEAKGDSKRGQN
jgi:hypothetical protein